MYKSFLSIFLLLATCLTASAKQRTEQELQQEALSFLYGKTSKAKGAIKRNQTITATHKFSQLTIYDGNTGKSVILSNDDVFEPILGYTDATITEDMAPAFVWWVNNVNTAMEKILKNGGVYQKAYKDSKYKEEVPALMTTSWSQEEPYSNECPTYTKNSRTYHYVTGCVATAMAQIMNYHKYPEKGKGYNRWTYYPNGSNNPGTTARVTFNSTYDWNNMIDSYKKGYTDEQAKAVAILMRDCGGAVSMQYSESGSGAYTQDACLALRDKFRYHAACKMYSRDYYPKDMWMDLIYKELNDECPILFGAATTSYAGHEFVLDGYDKDGLVHVNWGWNGTNNGFFDVSLLNSREGDFTEQQEIVIIRQPDDERYQETYHSMWGLDTSMNASINAKVLSLGNLILYNIDVESFTGNIQLIAENVNDANQKYELIQSEQINDISYGAGVKVNIKADVSKLPDGNYRVYLATRSNDSKKPETEWQPIYSSEDIVSTITLSVSNGTYTIKKSDWTTAIKQIAGLSATDSHTIVYDMQGKEVYKAKTADFNIDNIQGKGIFIIKQGNVVKKVVK